MKHLHNQTTNFPQISTLAIVAIMITSFLYTSLNIHASVSTLYDSHGTKSNGMGGTYTGIDDSSETIFYNWAIPTHKHYREWKFEQSKKLSTKYYTLSINNPLRIKNSRIGCLYSGISNIIGTSLNSSNQPIETGKYFNQSLIALFSSYTIPHKWINVGFRHTLYYEKISSESGQSNQFDIALFKPITLYKIPINIGTTFHNMTQSPIKWTTGYTDKSHRIYSANISSSLYKNKLLIAYSHYYSSYHHYNSNRLGVNYYIFGNPNTNPYSSIYAGYNNHIITAGTSLNMDGWILDYTWSYYNPFSTFNNKEFINEHRLSIGKSLKPFIPIDKLKEKTISQYNEKSLFKETTRTSAMKTSLITNAHLTIDIEKSTCNFFLSHINESIDHKFNGKFIVEDINYTITLPIFWTITYPDSNEVTMITIEKTNSNKLHISGFIPDNNTLFINTNEIIDINPDKSFYYKIDTTNKSQHRLEIDVLAKKNQTFINLN